MSRWSPASGRPPVEREPWYDPALALGPSGPTRVAREDDADPTYEPTRIRGFGIADIAPEQVQRIADAGGMTFADAAWAMDLAVDAFRPPPLLWQDEGDQA